MIPRYTFKIVDTFSRAGGGIPSVLFNHGKVKLIWKMINVESKTAFFIIFFNFRLCDIWRSLTDCTVFITARIRFTCSRKLKKKLG